MTAKKSKKKITIGLRLRFRDAQVFSRIKKAAEIADVSMNKFIVKNALSAANTVIHQHETGRDDNFVSSKG
jgi:uncharacterized protein (DUF1778 family)